MRKIIGYQDNTLGMLSKDTYISAVGMQMVLANRSQFFFALLHFDRSRPACCFVAVSMAPSRVVTRAPKASAGAKLVCRATRHTEIVGFRVANLPPCPE